METEPLASPEEASPLDPPTVEQEERCPGGSFADESVLRASEHRACDCPPSDEMIEELSLSRAVAPVVLPISGTVNNDHPRRSTALANITVHAVPSRAFFARFSCAIARHEPLRVDSAELSRLGLVRGRMRDGRSQPPLRLRPGRWVVMVGSAWRSAGEFRGLVHSTEYRVGSSAQRIHVHQNQLGYFVELEGATAIAGRELQFGSRDRPSSLAEIEL